MYRQCLWHSGWTFSGHNLNEPAVHRTCLPQYQAPAARLTHDPVIDVGLDQDLTAEPAPHVEVHCLVVGLTSWCGRGNWYIR